MDWSSFRFGALFTLLVVIVHIGSGDAIGCSDTSIGIENANIFPNNRFTATSTYDNRYAASNARLQVNVMGWDPKTNDLPSDHLQIDLGSVYIICAVATQGSAINSEWVRDYLITTSVDGSRYTTYRENGADKLFTGNTDKNSIVKNSITELRVRYIRFYPRQYNAHKTMRVGLFGYKEECAKRTIGLENKYIIPDSSLTATSRYDNRYYPYHARLNGNLKGWAAKTNTDSNDYLQIDIGPLPYVICAVATQGNSGGSEWVTQYKISLSVDGTRWTIYQESGVDKVFQGNIDHSIIMLNELTKTTARYIRFTPTAYNSHKTMRVGVFGYLEACIKRPIGMESGAIQDGSITASSNQHPAKNARLHYTLGSSWCASTSDSTPYLQIDLGTTHLICAVATQGNSQTDQWVKTYQITTSNDGSTWATYTENSATRTFYGNYDRTTVVRQVLYHSVVARYLRILPKTSQTGTPCLRTEIYGYPSQTSCSSHSVGIPSSLFVPDHRFTATSTNSNSYLPHKGRLGAASAWATKTNTNSGDYLQVDLGAMFYICVVATQGNGYGANEWVTKYKISYSTNSNQWNTYSESGADKEFTGNTDKTTVVSNSITNQFKAKFVRVQPTTYNGHKSMRIEFKGIAAGCVSPFGLENSKIKDSQMTSSSSSDNSHTAPRGRLYGSSSWCSSTNGNTEYIQVDLGQVKTVTGIATQGDKTVDKWTITYKVSYSFGKGVWFEYREGASSKIFDGNTNKNDVRVNWLTHPMAARYVKVLPQVSRTGHCLRLELYGCEFFYPISASLNTANVVLPSKKNSYENLTCSVVGEPLPDVQWLNNGTSISGATQSNIQLVFNSAAETASTYSCSRPDPSKRAVVCNKFYTCRAKYIFIVPSGTVDEATAKVTVYLNVSEAPTVTAVPFQRSIHLNWTLPNPSDEVGAITSYVIEFNNQSSIKTISVGHQASPYNLTYLRPYTNYTVRIRAISAPGQGLWSPLVSVRTIIEEPEGIPSITSLTALTSQSIGIDWQFTQSDKVNGPMAGFRITYKKEGGAINMIDVGDIRSYNLTSLEKNTNYKVNVSVRNTQYVGQPSVEAERRTLEDAPECAPVLKSVQSLSSKSVLLIWSSLQNQKCTNGVLRGYKVLYRESSNESLPFNVHTVNIPSAITTVVSGLVQSVEYKFQVRAFTVKDGTLSNSLLGTAQPVGNLSIVNEKMTPLVRAAIGEKVSIGCYATGARPISYNWLKKDRPMNSSSLKVLHNFLLVDVKSELDFGLYLCNVTNNNGEVVSYEVRIEQLNICEKSEGNGNLTILRDRMTSLIRAGMGDRVVIGCYATGRQPIRYNWTLNGAPIISSAARVIHNVLVLEPKTANDYGIYVCNVTNENGTDSYPIKLTQLETCKGPNSTRGNVTILSDKMTSLVKATLNEKVILSCYATGAPPIRYIWTKDGAPINSSSINVIGNTVIVEPKNAEDYGAYLCEATNGNQTASYEVKLELSEICQKVNISSQQDLKILREKMTSLIKAAIGQNISIGCYATGAQPIRYNWTKDGSPISSPDVKVIDNILFVQPKTPMDYGSYLCSVSNQNKSVSYAVELSPWESCEQRSNSSENTGKLQILTNMMTSSVIVAIGNRASIGCYATGVPPIRYSWTKDGIPVNPSAVMQNVLVVQPMTSMDYGNYLCSVSNGNETDSYSIQVKLLGKCASCPDSDKNKTQGNLQILREKMTPLVRARYGDKVSIGCYATGAPPIKYSWTKNNHPIVNSETIKVLENAVVVRPNTTADYGTFVCSVSNGREISSYVIKLERVDVYVGGDPNPSQSRQEFKTTYLPIMIVLAIIIIILLIIIVYLARRKQNGNISSKNDPYMKMDDIIRLRNETTRNVHASLPPVPTSAAAAAACNTQTESHYDSIDHGGYVNAAALTKIDEPNDPDFEDVYALKNSRA